ncbi:S8 family serine peptidase [Sorangium sp. So ce385]|uniref:S8 family serine peptidase n=1 Tax=Sorangium sp. So ce385 TaxID=3133308 RepID=UPI003F5BCF58
MFDVILGISAVPSILSPFVLVTWAGPAAGPTVAEVNALRASTPRLSEDCVTVGPLADWEATNQAFRTWQRDLFLEQVGALRPLPTGKTAVYIAVPDTSPDGHRYNVERGTSEHGYTMAEIARSVSCPGKAVPDKIRNECRTNVITTLALPHITNEVTKPKGGYFGTPVELAEAIYRAVAKWQQRADEKSNLVINLSVGWQPQSTGAVLGADPTKPVPAPENAVLSALRYASCHKALILAAAGNHPRGGSFHYGPTYPAAWQSLAAPTTRECRDFLSDHESPPTEPAGSHTPPPIFPPSANGELGNSLVFAIGGTNRAHMPIDATRPGSLSRLAAPAVQGVAGAPNELPVALTGTSVATAVVSGTAAAVWSHLPQHTPLQVMQMIYESGMNMKLTDTDLLAAPAYTEWLREVNLCRAVGRALSLASAKEMMLACSPSTADFQVPAPGPNVQNMIDDLFHKSIHVNASGSLKPPFPNKNLPSIAAAPWVHPHPNDPGCGFACYLKIMSKSIVVSINPAYQGGTLSNMVLLVRYSDQSVDTLYPAINIEMSRTPPNNRFSFNGLPLSYTPNGQKYVVEAKLSWTVTNNKGQAGSTEESIPFVYQ